MKKCSECENLLTGLSLTELTAGVCCFECCKKKYKPKKTKGENK